MPDPVREVRGIRRGSSPPEEVRAVIYEVEHGVRDAEHSCLIHCPEIFDTDKRIVGVDDDQALELSELLVGMMFDHHEIDVVEVKAL